ncbi:MAG TPA: hypothetical protein VGC67_08500 [Cellulomonas sp.]
MREHLDLPDRHGVGLVGLRTTSPRRISSEDVGLRAAATRLEAWIVRCRGTLLRW